MSTNQYLASLNLDQLIYARDLADKLISAKKQEKRRIVWCVEDNITRLAFFPDDRYVDAAEFLLRKARDNASLARHPHDKRLRVDCIHVLESEYGEFEADFEPIAQDEQDEAWDDIELAEMIMSDCGISSNYEPLKDRIAKRIAKHVAAKINDLTPGD